VEITIIEKNNICYGSSAKKEERKSEREKYIK
jgi:hypothetical protein